MSEAVSAPRPTPYLSLELRVSFLTAGIVSLGRRGGGQWPLIPASIRGWDNENSHWGQCWPWIWAFMFFQPFATRLKLGTSPQSGFPLHASPPFSSYLGPCLVASDLKMIHALICMDGQSSLNVCMKCATLVGAGSINQMWFSVSVIQWIQIWIGSFPSSDLSLSLESMNPILPRHMFDRGDSENTTKMWTEIYRRRQWRQPPTQFICSAGYLLNIMIIKTWNVCQV